MKKMVVVAVLALAVVAVAEHKVSAWSLFKVNHAFNLTFGHGPSRVTVPVQPPFQTGLFGPDAPMPAPSFAGYAGYACPPAAPIWQAPPPSAPHAAPPPKPAAQSYYRSPWGNEYQPVSAQYSSYYGVPSYWYGR
jgi:hypothetical protein